jgi:hypothetical protein
MVDLGLLVRGYIPVHVILGFRRLPCPASDQSTRAANDSLQARISDSRMPQNGRIMTAAQLGVQPLYRVPGPDGRAVLGGCLGAEEHGA